MTDDATMAQVVQNACFSADEVAIGWAGTPADRTRATIRRALEALEANGLIRIVPMDEWPDYYVPMPPYVSPFPDPATSMEET